MRFPSDGAPQFHLPYIVLFLTALQQGDKQSNYSLNQADRRTENAQNFIRKGMVGDWQSYFSDEQSAEFDRVYAEVITARSDLRFRFTL